MRPLHFHKTLQTTLVLATLLLASACSGGTKKTTITPAASDPLNGATPTVNAQDPSPFVGKTPSSETPDNPGSNIHSPFQLSLDLPAMNLILLQAAIMKSLKGEIIQQIPGFSLTSPFNVTIKGIHLDLKYQFNSPALNQTTQQWEFSTQSISAELNVDNITADEVVQVNSGGTQMDVRLSGSCDHIRLSLPAGSTHASGTIQLSLKDNQPILSLTSFQPQWTPGSWQIATMSCEGPQGFGEVVARTVSEQLRQVDPYIQILRQEIENKLATMVQYPVTLSMDLGDTVSLSLIADTFAQIANQPTAPVVVNGKVDFHFKKVAPNTGCGASFEVFHQFPASGQNGNELVLPFEATQSLISCAYLNHSLQYSFNSGNLPAFASLMKNFFEKLIVWPDLLNFSRNSDFALKLLSPKIPALANPWKSAENTISLDAWIPMELDVLAPQGTDHIPYLNFLADFSGKASLRISDGNAQVVIDPSANFKINTSWDSNYVAQHHPNERIWMDRIDSAAIDFLSTQGVSFPLPSFQISELLSLVPVSADLRESENVHLTIRLDQKSAN